MKEDASVWFYLTLCFYRREVAQKNWRSFRNSTLETRFWKLETRASKLDTRFPKSSSFESRWSTYLWPVLSYKLRINSVSHCSILVVPNHLSGMSMLYLMWKGNIWNMQVRLMECWVCGTTQIWECCHCGNEAIHRVSYFWLKVGNQPASCRVAAVAWLQ